MTFTWIESLGQQDILGAALEMEAILEESVVITVEVLQAGKEHRPLGR